MQFFNAICNTNSIVTNLLPQIQVAMQGIFSNRELIEIQRCKSKVAVMEAKLIQLYSSLRSVALAENKMQIHSQYYPKKAKSENDVHISLNFKLFLVHLAKLYKLLHSDHYLLHFSKRNRVVPSLIDKFVSRLELREEGEFWSRLSAPDVEAVTPNFTSTPAEASAPVASLVQPYNVFEASIIVLDLKFMLEACNSVMYPRTKTR